MKKIFTHKITLISGYIMLANIIIATFLSAWNIKINPAFIFMYQPYVVVPLVSIYYWFFLKKK